MKEIIMKEILYISISLMFASTLLFSLLFLFLEIPVIEMKKIEDVLLILFVFFIFFYCLIKALTIGHTETFITIKTKVNL